MPYHIEQRGKQWCVVKGHSGESGAVVHCHDTRTKAVAQMRALYAAEDAESVAKKMRR